jgi:hypothetical protein
MNIVLREEIRDVIEGKLYRYVEWHRARNAADDVFDALWDYFEHEEEE